MNPKTIIFNFSIISLLFLICYIYLPIILLYTPLAQYKQQEPSSYSIEIPKIKAVAPIIANVDPWEKSSYEDPLKQGVAQAKGFADFGNKGTIFLFAHASLPPWDITRANTAFFRLNELTKNDEIVIKKFDKTYIYKVTEIREVWPDEVIRIIDSAQNQLILQTTTPFGTDFRRLLIFAEPAKSE